MKELYAKVSMEDWQESGGPLELSCQEVGLALKRDEVKEGFFTVTGEPGQVTEGYVSCDEERMECLTSFFSGTRENIEYRFDSRGMREGEERKGRFLIVSNRGEYEIPFHVVVLHKVLESSEGELMNLFQFTNRNVGNFTSGSAGGGNYNESACFLGNQPSHEDILRLPVSCEG